MTSKTKSKPLSLRFIMSLLGPAFVAAIAYVDPGNFATNTAAGARYGYLLLWVLVVANVMASLVQYLSAKLGLVSGLSLPELIAARLSPNLRRMYWLQAELIALATDIAEVIGGAIALQLLFGLPLLLGGIVVGCVSLLLLLIQSPKKQKIFERIMIGLLLIIPIGFIGGLLLRPPRPSSIVHGLIPNFAGGNSILLATGIIGATVMPHVIYLHSALARDRHGQVDKSKLRSLLTATRIDVALAMFVAGGINIVMLLLAASALHGSNSASSLSQAHTSLSHLLSPVVGLLFALGLLVSGLASTAVGCYAGSAITSGLLKRRVPMVLRRSITIIPALLIIVCGVEPTQALILSQVVLSFGIPFAIIPLVTLTSSATLMGAFINRRITNLLAWLVTGTIVGLNALLLIYAF